MAKGESGGAASRGLETHSGPHTGLLMTGDVACARPLSPGSGEGPRIPGTRVRRGEESGVPSNALVAGRVAPDRWLVALVAHACEAISASSVPWLELDVWLTRSLPRYAARNFSIEKTVPRDSM